jgi:purine-cytosine permease-like protein
MSLGRWGCGAGVAGREWRLETLTVILAGVRFSFLALLLLILLLGLLVACTSAQGQRNRRSHKKQDRMSLRR